MLEGGHHGWTGWKLLTGGLGEADDGVLGRHVRDHAGRGGHRVGRPEQDDRALAQAALAVTAGGVPAGLLLGHGPHGRAEEQGRALDDRVRRLGEDAEVHVRREGPEILKIDLRGGGGLVNIQSSYAAVCARAHVILSEVGTYSSTVDGVVDASKLLHRGGDEVVHALLVGDVHLDRDGSILCEFGVSLALLGSLPRAFVVDVREDDAVHTGLRVGKGGLFADARGGLSTKGCQREVLMVKQRSRSRHRGLFDLLQPPRRCHRQEIAWTPFWKSEQFLLGQ